jgi:hypothetical protein
MPFRKKGRNRKKSSAMQKRVNKLEKQIIPVLKTFEQRQFDYWTPAATGYDGEPLSWGTPIVYTLAELMPTYQDGAAANFQTGKVRLGDKVTLKSLRIRGEVRAATSTSTAAEQTNIVRLILVRFPDDIISLTNAEIVSAVLQQYPTVTGTSISTLTSMYSQYKNVLEQGHNELPLHRYEVLYDKIQRLSNPSPNKNRLGSETFRAGFDIKKMFKKGLVCQYGKYNVAAPTLNNMALICLSDSNISPHPDISFTSRFKYMDA